MQSIGLFLDFSICRIHNGSPTSYLKNQVSKTIGQLCGGAGKHCGR